MFNDHVVFDEHMVNYIDGAMNRAGEEGEEKGKARKGTL